MKILIDGYWWVEGPHSNRMVLLEIVRQWVHDYPDDEIVLAVPRGSEVDSELTPSPSVQVVRTRLRIHPAINCFELPLIRRRLGIDAILAFNFASFSRHGAVFIHDVLFQSNPEWFTRIERVYFSAMPLLARSSPTVIATSRTERDRIARFNPKLRRIVACGLSVPPSLLDATEQDPGLALTEQSFLLCVGRLNVRKNLELTIDACLHSGAVSASCPIVVVGEPSGRVAEFSGEFAAAIADGRIAFVEKVSDGKLKWLYRHCRLFISLSLDEGFGLPPVEAAILGAPVLASDVPIFRETVGGYATLVDPRDHDAIALAVRRMTENRQQPLPYVEQHSWQSVCTAIRAELQRLI